MGKQFSGTLKNIIHLKKNLWENTQHVFRKSHNVTSWFFQNYNTFLNMFFLISFVYFSYSLQCEIYVSWLNPVFFFSSLTFTTWSICPSSHAEIKRDKERRARFSLSPSPSRSCLGRCVPPLFVYFGKEAPLSTCLLRVKEGLTAANCALQQAPCMQPGPCRPASALQPRRTWSNTVK